MCKIGELSDAIIKNDKMTASEIIDFIGKSMESGKDTDCVYRELYEKAYGRIITRELADSWVKNMEVTDGTDRENGMKWSLDATTEVGNKISIDWHTVTKNEWYVAMNLMYSDFYRTAKTVDRQNDPVFFANLAKDWIYDDDAPSDKIYRYYFDIVSCTE